VRAPNERELKQTQVVALPIEEASAKIRSGPPKDSPDDVGMQVWAGVVPLRLAPGEPVAVDDLPPGVPLPPYVSSYRRDGTNDG
jgi:hypothetical protein